MKQVVGKNQTVELEFMGQKLAIKSQGKSPSDTELLKEAVAIASLKLKDVENRSKTAVAHQVALLALLEMCEEYLKAKRRAGEMRERVIEKTRTLVEMTQATFNDLPQ